MPISGSAVYLSTVLLEKNRWNGKGPSLLVSDWMEPIGEAGFAGLEIWMNHLLFASRSEWELIKEKALESDLAVALISSGLPSDLSDKSRRLREAILEACDYFRPDGLKFSLVEDARGKGGDLSDMLGFVKDWVKDMPREIGLLYAGWEGKPGLQGLPQARKILEGGRCKAVIHPFLLSAGQVEEALDAVGDFIANLGVQARKDDQWSLLGEAREENLNIVASTRRKGFKGTWSLEFTKGAGLSGENIDAMFDHAEKDLNFLIEALARGSERT